LHLRNMIKNSAKIIPREIPAQSLVNEGIRVKLEPYQIAVISLENAK